MADARYARKWGVTNLPAIVYFRRRFPSIFRGDLHSDADVLEWLKKNRFRQPELNLFMYALMAIIVAFLIYTAFLLQCFKVTPTTTVATTKQSQIFAVLEAVLENGVFRKKIFRLNVIYESLGDHIEAKSKCLKFYDIIFLKNSRFKKNCFIQKFQITTFSIICLIGNCDDSCKKQRAAKFNKLIFFCFFYQTFLLSAVFDTKRSRQYCFLLYNYTKSNLVISVILLA